MSNSPKTIMIVEDEDDLRVLLSMRLRTVRGCRVVTATDGRSALALAEQEKPDLILMDLNMPHLDGFGAIEQIKGHAATTHIPIVAVSNHCWSFGWQDRASELGCVKCVDKTSLLQSVDSLLQQYTA